MKNKWLIMAAVFLLVGVSAGYMIQAFSKTPSAQTIPLPINSGPSSAAQTLSDMLSGIVKATTNSGGYTYVMIENDAQDIWAAAPEQEIAPGESVVFTTSMPMHDFYSPSMKKTFKTLYFVTSLKADAAPAALPAGHPPMQTQPSAPRSEAASAPRAPLAPAPEGDIVPLAELLKNRAAWRDKDILIRGSVIKSTPNVMGKNWVHVSDGNDHQVVCTTQAEVSPGQSITLKGHVTLDKDIGAGYFYEVLLEDCEVFSGE